MSLGDSLACGTLAAAVWLLTISSAGAVQARPQVASRPAGLAFDIGARPLSAAIEAYALTTGIQVLYDRPSSEALRSHGVSGVYTPEAALRLLLTDTGLEPEFTSSHSVVLRPSRPAAAPPSFGPPPAGVAVLPLDTLDVRGVATIAEEGTRLDLKLYGGLVRSAVHQALLNPRYATGGSYRVTLRLWIDPRGLVTEMAAADSSGDARRDLAIAEAMRGLRISAPPPEGLPQPVVLTITSRPAG
ncbi:TonB family protein [Caulobacter endophyticus]|uniref:TonB family protein n=1 Tax=Caulobacter endophyticus TaxID=2172652 RepID=UPI00240F391A|nr:TonB family protein [Caulobacter endophyticus]MDG2527266.1 TonB family protein [Caulobacter endophyticus]